MLESVPFEYAMQLLLSSVLKNYGANYKDKNEDSQTVMFTSPLFLIYPIAGCYRTIIALSAVWIGIFLFTVFAAVYFFFRIGQKENLVKPLFYRSNTTRVFTFNDVFDLFWKL